MSVKNNSNTRNTRILRVLAALLCAVVFTVFTVPAGAASAAETEGDRLYTRTKNVWLNGKGTVTFTLSGHKDGEELNVTPADKSLVTVKVGKWSGDRVNVVFTPKKTADTSVTVECGGESIALKLHMRKAAAMTSEEIYEYMHDAAVEIKTWDSAGNVYIGSGFFIGSGEVLTDYHVVSSASKMTVTDYNGKEYAVKSIIAYSEASDLILIRTATGNKSALSLARSVAGGARMYAFGSPAGVTATFSSGLVSNPSVKLDGIRYFQSTMPSGIGSGGGPMVNEYGQVLGAMALTVPAAQNLNFGIRYDVIQKFLERISAGSALSLKDFYAKNAGKVKDSNDYGIFSKASNAVKNTAFETEFRKLAPEEIYALAHDAMVDIVVGFEDGSGAGGSGFFIDDETIVTCAHVLSHGGIASISIVDYNGNEYTAGANFRISTDYDVALLTVSLKKGSAGHTSIGMAPGYLPTGGERVYAFGSPAGYSCTFSEGITVVSDARLSELECSGLGISTELDYILFSAPIYSGSSGGVLLNVYGQAIGIVSGLINATENLNLGIQIDQISKAK